VLPTRYEAPTPPAGGVGHLPRTGGVSTEAGIIGLVFLGAGGVLLVASRRRS